MAWAQQADSNDTESPVIPPAPLIQKRNPKAISIPIADSARYQQQAAAATNVKITADAVSNSKAAGTGSSTAPVGVASSNAAATKAVPGNTASTNTASTAAISTNAKVGSSFGYRRDPFTRREKFHAGCDIKAHWGQPVGASLPGTVQFAGWSHGYGNLIIVEHGGGVATHYAHLSSFAVEPGEHVERGSIIGYAGSTGRATSPHLHYEVRLDGSAVNPLEVLALDESSDFFKNAAAARIVQAAWAAQNPQPARTDSVKPDSVKPDSVKPDSTKPVAEPAVASQPKTSGVEHAEPSQSKPATDSKAATPSAPQPPAGDAGVSQERPRRVNNF
jgi:murein DD-endopeptidase MepM/ murein hydrolase activator NlpD